MRTFLMLIASLAGAPAAAAPEWRQARDYEIILSSYDIKPETIRLRAGQPLRLRLINNSGQQHSFQAKDFFAASQLRSRDAKSIVGGGVTVAAGETRELVLVPAPGRYRARSGNLLHRLLGMSGAIIVE